MSDLKENIITEILKYRPMKYLITFLLLILSGAILYSIFNHIYRCHNNQNSILFWGMDQCEECKILPTKIDTVYKMGFIHDTSKSVSQTKLFSLTDQNKETMKKRHRYYHRKLIAVTIKQT